MVVVTVLKALVLTECVVVPVALIVDDSLLYPERVDVPQDDALGVEEPERDIDGEFEPVPDTDMDTVPVKVLSTVGDVVDDVERDGVEVIEGVIEVAAEGDDSVDGETKDVAETVTEIDRTLVILAVVDSVAVAQTVASIVCVGVAELETDTVNEILLVVLGVRDVTPVAVSFKDADTDTLPETVGVVEIVPEAVEERDAVGDVEEQLVTDVVIRADREALGQLE